MRSRKPRRLHLKPIIERQKEKLGTVRSGRADGAGKKIEKRSHFRRY